MSEVKVWADSFGLWHAEVPLKKEWPKELALRAIVSALIEREGPAFAPESVKVEVIANSKGWVHYREIDN